MLDPPASRRARTVPFDWSPRCRAALSSAYDRWDVLEASVTDTDPATRVTSVRPERVEFTDLERQSVETAVALGDVIHAERTELTGTGQLAVSDRLDSVNQ